MHANDDLLALGRSRKMTRSSQLIAEFMKRLLRRRYALKGDRFKSVVQACSESRTACAAWWHRGGALLDAAMYAAVMNKLGVIKLMVTSNLNVNFLHPPSGTLLAEARALKVVKRLAMLGVIIFSETNNGPVAHATGTYSVPQRDA